MTYSSDGILRMEGVAAAVAIVFMTIGCLETMDTVSRTIRWAYTKLTTKDP